MEWNDELKVFWQKELNKHTKKEIINLILEYMVFDMNEVLLALIKINEYKIEKLMTNNIRIVKEREDAKRYKDNERWSRLMSELIKNERVLDRLDSMVYRYTYIVSHSNRKMFKDYSSNK